MPAAAAEVVVLAEPQEQVVLVVGVMEQLAEMVLLEHQILGAEGAQLLPPVQDLVEQMVVLAL